MSCQRTRLFEFGPYRLDVMEKRLLSRGVEVISLPRKTFELLILLVESDGRALSRQEGRSWTVRPNIRLERPFLSIILIVLGSRY